MRAAQWCSGKNCCLTARKSWEPHVLPVAAWVISGYSLPQAKNMQTGGYVNWSC